jgi:hypothetical protein
VCFLELDDQRVRQTATLGDSLALRAGPLADRLILCLLFG